MATPLYKQMKQRGTSFYAFPSAASDLNLANYNDFYDLNFTKFALINIPRQVNGQPNPIDGIMDFLPKSDKLGVAPFCCDDPNYTTPTKLSDQLVESLRNYVANYDTSLHESRINGNTDFYNIGERYTPTEMILFKWLRKLNLIDFEPAVHKVDWDKNLSDFDNKNKSTVTNLDYFRKYLWKEREITDYQTISVHEDSTYTYTNPNTNQTTNTPLFVINEIAKFKIGDKVILKTSDSNDIANFALTQISLGQQYTIGNVDFTGGTTKIWLDTAFTGDIATLNATYMYLDYNRLIQYVGEINQITNIQTASRVGQEVTAYIPHQGGRTPTVLFGVRDNTNYYPNLEIPILADEIQTEIVGSESLNSPIRTDPQNYPGSYFGQFDTVDNTYLCSNGDSVRKQGDYYGVILTDNTGLNADSYVEKLTDFNSDAIDGVFLDVDRNHYYKMNIPGLETQNFDEFSSLSIEGQAPEDFDFNAILWYYELIERDSNNNVNSYVNLYGIEFLNNPENDDDSYSNLITPYHKLVTNGVHDGLSYMFNLNLHYNIDNDVVPLTYDPSTIYNMFSFDMYNEMMRRFYQVNENFVNIIQEFVRINMDLQDMKSLIYSQTDIDDLKSRMKNMEDLLKLYATNQFVDSDSARISVDYSGVYPKLKFNVIGVEYDDIKNLSLTDVYNFNQTNTGASYSVTLSYSSKMLLNLINDNTSNNNFGPVVLTLDRDLKNKQRLDIFIKPEYAQYAQTLSVNMMFTSGVTKKEINIFSVVLPKDLLSYNILVPESSVFDDSFYLNDNIYVNSTSFNTGSTPCSTGYTQLTLTENMFKTGNTVYVQNLYLLDNSGNTADYSGAYKILCKSGTTSGIGTIITIDLKTSEVVNYKLLGVPKVSYYRGLQVSILRVDGSDSSSFNQRYDVSYKII
jgi:hypothetical protein